MKHQNQTQDTEITLKEIPMLTSDGVAIKLNGILYRQSWSHGYSFKGTAKGSIEAWRVFHVNNSARNFRIRCSKGCEETIQFNNGCSTKQLFGKLATAKNYILKSTDQDLKKCDKKQKEVLKTKRAIIKERIRIMRLDKINLPKEVK